MDKQYWLNRWVTKEVGFHQTDFEFYLLEHFSQIKPTSVFLPLCGKTRDMVWLANKGHQVIGVELSPLACHEFFQDNYQGAYTKQDEGAFTVFKGGNTTLFCGDFFDINKNHLKGVTAVYDRAALIALPPELRKRYTSHLQNLFTGNIEMLLIALEYDQTKMQGPPFSVSDAEVCELYKGAKKLIKLHHEQSVLSPRAAPPGTTLPILENIYRIEF